ncbi:MAG: methyltransferase domain-containing protein [Methylococcus sp.]|nr:methyltransferase domain-containing protein [Methylococcus sp.]
MKISWITFASLRAENGKIASDMASARYRMLLPGEYLRGQGHEIAFHSIGLDVCWESYPRDSLDADVVIFSKSFNRANEEAASFARANGAKVIFDVSDNHFRNPELSGHYHAMAVMANQVTVPTAAMGKAVSEHTGIAPAIIPDPVEGQRKLPAAIEYGKRRFGLFPARRQAVRLLWFGHPSNLPALLEIMRSLMALAKEYPIALDIVTSRNALLEGVLWKQAMEGGKDFRLSFSEWSPQAMENALDRCDLVIIPSDIEGTRESVKSHNRLAEALWAGKYVVAHPLPAYQDFIDWAWISEDLIAGIKWALTHPDMASAQVAQAQSFIEDHFSPENIGARWAEAISEVNQGTQRNEIPVGILTVADPTRLNLGCGDKVLTGYLNFDVAASRDGKKPDIICDLRTLPIEDDSADEVLSVHVVEHFWRWEVQDVLREWIRVLKPGGTMIVECPNLMAACQEIIRHPESVKGEGMECRRSMWVLYGDPSWHDPLMVHRWGYTPESLADLMRQSGLTHVRQEPAQFKLREPRDMRVVGMKPHSS